MPFPLRATKRKSTNAKQSAFFPNLLRQPLPAKYLLSVAGLTRTIGSPSCAERAAVHNGPHCTCILFFNSEHRTVMAPDVHIASAPSPQTSSFLCERAVSSGLVQDDLRLPFTQCPRDAGVTRNIQHVFLAPVFLTIIFKSLPGACDSPVRVTCTACHCH